MNAAILGFGKSGKAAFNILKKLGFRDIDIFDDKKDSGYPSIDKFKDIYDKTVVSPGVDIKKYPNIPAQITSEVELAFEAMPDDAKLIAITGTNGKSTTTHLAAQILNNAGLKAVACGNIGLTFGEAVEDKSVKVFVVELSSFQIELLNRFRADSACIINVTQDHLNRYGTMDNYYAAKLKLLNFVSNEGLFLYGTDEKIARATESCNFITRAIDKKLHIFPQLKGNILDFEAFSVDKSKFHLFGHHNLINLSFALGLVSGILDLEGDVTKYIEGLSGMPYRTELVGKFRGVSWINDSKGTNVDSVVTALESASKPTYLLIGGRDKSSDYTVLAPLINKNVSYVCYFGEAADLIKNQLSSLIDAEESSFEHLEDAVKFCAEVAEEGSTVLLSPACASFDEYSGYEERGEKFAEYVRKYANR